MKILFGSCYGNKYKQVLEARKEVKTIINKYVGFIEVIMHIDCLL